MNKICTFFLLIFFIFSCKSFKNKESNVDNKSNITKDYIGSEKIKENGATKDKPITIVHQKDITFGFSIRRGEAEQGAFIFFELLNGNKLLYRDTINEFKFPNLEYPIILKNLDQSYDLLFEVFNGPSLDYLKCIRIKNDKVIELRDFPHFIAQSKDIDHDGIKEYAGYWDSFEIWGDSANKTDYNPIIYYKITDNGLILDTALTIKRNAKIYGKFYGFNFDEKIEMPTSVLNRFKKECNSIKSNK